MGSFGSSSFRFFVRSLTWWPPLFGSLNSRDDVLDFDTKLTDDDMGGTVGATGEFDLGTAVELLGLDDDDARTQASKLEGAYMAFLLLRHLRLRDLQRTVRTIVRKPETGPPFQTEAPLVTPRCRVFYHSRQFPPKLLSCMNL